MLDECGLHDFCVDCKQNRLAQKDGPLDEDTNIPLYSSGDFIIECDGIPKDNKFIPKYDQIVKSLSPEEIETAQGLYDPIIWAKEKLGWEPRESVGGIEYQKMILRCSSKRKVMRLGRRLGKTECLVVAILHYLYTNSPKVQRWDKNIKKWVDGFSTIMVLTPYLSQQKLIFSRIRQLIEKNPELQNEIKRDVSTPYHEIELYNGARIVGFSSGAKSGSGAETSRGQKADFIVLDEMDYLNENDLETIIALLMEHSDVRLLCSSTPSGRREHFYKFCMERMDFKEFFYTSMVNPSWTKKMEVELREFYSTEIGWQHEILAEFGEAVTSVFQNKYVQTARANYRYKDLVPENAHTYSIGIDWNDAENGTKLCVLCWDPKRECFTIVEKVTVQKAGWTQLKAIQELIRLNRAWKPDFIYVDEGYGACQLEVIKQYGLDARYRKDKDSKVDEKLAYVFGVNFSSKIETFDPVSGEPIKKHMKPFMVENAVRRFEQEQIKFSMHDEVLHRQLLGYQVVRTSASGMPIYQAGNEGDHDLDALMMALLAFQLEFSEFTNRSYSTDIRFSGRIGESINNAASKPLDMQDADGGSSLAGPKGPQEREKLEGSIATHGVPMYNPSHSGIRIYSAQAFNNDDPRSVSNRRKLLNPRKRSMAQTRQLF